MNRTTLRATVLLDRDLIVRWVQPTIERLLGMGPDLLIGISALDLLHPDDVGPVAAILAYEQVIDVSVRSSAAVRSVRIVRLRHHDGHWHSLEASLSNQYYDPEVGHLLVDLQAPSQLHMTQQVIEQTRLGADLSQILTTILGMLTAADPGGLGAAIIAPDGTVLAVTSSAPAPYADGDPRAYRCNWTVPLVDSSQDRPNGTLHVWCSLPSPHPLDLESSHQVAAHAALVIGRQRAFEELRTAALRDPLTGLANRRAVEMEFQERQRAGTRVMVIYIDLDGFKAINDRIGHDAGDQVLRVVAERLSRSLRRGDVIARMGGDEFVLLISSPSAHRDMLRERLQDIIGAPIVVSGQAVSVSASIGISEGPATSTDLLRHADSEMLAAKQRRESPRP